jgi:hypothetical protein
MRVFRPCLLFAALGAISLAAVAPDSPAPEGAVRIVRTFSGWREADSFKRISEYFNGRENTGGEIVVRTHPDQRGGYYFLVRVVNDGAPVGAHIVLHVVTPDNAAPRTFTFDTTLPGKEAVFDLGVTGTDWPDAKIHAVAWRLDLLDGAGRTLATGKSYLWDKPSGE